MLENIQSLDKNSLEYDESFRALEDDLADEKNELNVKPEESPEIFDRPFQASDEFNISETEEKKQNSDLEAVRSSQILQSNFPARTDKKRTSLSSTDPSWSPSAFSFQTINVSNRK